MIYGLIYKVLECGQVGTRYVYPNQKLIYSGGDSPIY